MARNTGASKLGSESAFWAVAGVWRRWRQAGQIAWPPAFAAVALGCCDSFGWECGTPRLISGSAAGGRFGHLD